MEADVEKSEVHATVEEPMGLIRDHPTATGNFRLVSGAIDGDTENPVATAHVKLVIDATTYDSGNNLRDRAVIHSALETAKYQTIIFESRSFEDADVEVPGVSGSATVVGNLTLHGQTHLIKVPNVRISMTTDGEFSAGGEFTLKYTDYGISAPRLLVLPVSSEVSLAFRIVAERPGSPAEQALSKRDSPAPVISASRRLAAR